MSENAISALTVQQAVAFEAFLEPGFSVLGVARKMGLPIAAVLEILTSAPVAAALDGIRQVQHLRLEIAQTAAFTAATEALGKLLPTIQGTRETRRAATAILRSIRPSRGGGATVRRSSHNGTHRPEQAGRASGSSPVLSTPSSVLTSTSPERERRAAPSEPRPSGNGKATDYAVADDHQSATAACSNGGFHGGRAPMECFSTLPAHNFTGQQAGPRNARSTGAAARLVAAAGIPGPAP